MGADAHDLCQQALIGLRQPDAGPESAGWPEPKVPCPRADGPDPRTWASQPPHRMR